MNFFGHAAIAARYSMHSGFVLGAMLPDFAAMLLLRTPPTTDPDLAGGVAFHHRTDAVFHACPTFCELSRAAFDWLLQAGLARGSARAVAHVGVEILLDSALAPQPGARQAYRHALEAADSEALGRSIEWIDEQARAKFEALRQLLLLRLTDASQFGSSATEFVTYRLERTMAGRPRLAIGVEGRVIVAQWVDQARHRIFERTSALVDEVHQGLAREPGAHSAD